MPCSRYPQNPATATTGSIHPRFSGRQIEILLTRQPFENRKNGRSGEVIFAAFQAGTDRNNGYGTGQDWSGQEGGDDIAHHLVQARDGAFATLLTPSIGMRLYGASRRMTRFRPQSDAYGWYR